MALLAVLWAPLRLTDWNPQWKLQTTHTLFSCTATPPSASLNQVLLGCSLCLANANVSVRTWTHSHTICRNIYRHWLFSLYSKHTVQCVFHSPPPPIFPLLIFILNTVIAVCHYINKTESVSKENWILYILKALKQVLWMKLGFILTTKPAWKGFKGLSFWTVAVQLGLDGR